MSAATLTRIEDKLQGLDPESLRARVLVALRQFRSSWVELGRLLNQVAHSGAYKEWGYDDLLLYAARELGLKAPTVKKLMVSYNYMKAREPGRLEAFEEKGPRAAGPIPDYQTVELLHRADNNPDIDREVKDELHNLAFSGAGEETELRRRLREQLSSPGAIEQSNLDRRREIEGVLRAARNLRRRLAASRHVPDSLRARIEQLLVELEALD